MNNINEVKSYKWTTLKNNPPKNAVLYVLDPLTKKIELFITDKNGVPRTVKADTDEIDISDYVDVGVNNAIEVRQNQLFVKKYVSGDDYIEITDLGNKYEVTFNDGKVELKENKQDSLDPDGTGTKYPTVDAVNEAFSNFDGDKHFTFEQSTPTTIWTFQHPLNKKPSVQVTDSAGTVIDGQIIINDGVNITIEFNNPIWGYAICN